MSTYIHKTIALGWCLSDATKILTREDMDAIEKEAEEINNNTGE